MQKTLKLGFFGGSFDPIHHGHLIAAQDAMEQLSLDELQFVPTAQAPLRKDVVRSKPEDRVEMIRLAVEAEPRFGVSAIEIERGGISYTIDTALALQAEHPGATLIWIIGQDQLAKLSDWYRIEDLCALLEFAYLQRPGFPDSAEPQIPGLRLHRLRSHQVEISSTEIRQRIREKRPLHFLLPEPVIRYIYERNLYH